MKGLFTKLFEDDADLIARKLARATKAAAVIYLWLYSRVFQQGNRIKYAQDQLAKDFGFAESTVNNAVKRLIKLGLISVETSNHGSIFTLLNLPDLEKELPQYCRVFPCGSGTAVASLPVCTSNTAGYIPANLKGLPSGNDGAIPAESLDNIDKNLIDNLDIEKDESLLELTEEVIGYLNDRAGTSFKANQSCQKLIRMWRGEGYGLDDFKRVVDNKCSEWLGTDFQTNLKPKTLFSSEHFEEYLNQLSAPAPTTNKQNGGNQNVYVSEYDIPLETDPTLG